MARPSKLTERQKVEIGRRLAQGESGRALAKEFRCSEGTIRANVSAHAATIRECATRLASVELDIERLPVSAQVSARSLADQMKGLQQDYLTGAATGVKTASKLQRIAGLRVAELDPATVQTEDIRLIAALTETANKAADMGSKLLAASKGSKEEQDNAGLTESIRKARMRVANGV